MNRLIVIAIAFIVWTVAVFAVGYQVRDGKADTVVAQAATAQQAARADNAEHARTTDHVDAQTAAHVEQQRVETSRANEATFNTIEGRAQHYATSNPDPGSTCDLDGDGLRAWREANAGAIGPEPGSASGTAGVVSRRPATAGQR